MKSRTLANRQQKQHHEESFARGRRALVPVFESIDVASQCHLTAASDQTGEANAAAAEFLLIVGHRRLHDLHGVLAAIHIFY
jgi:hypothetical protein